MFNLKIWWIVSINTLLIYSTTTIATSDNNNIDIDKNTNCCPYREKKAINDKLINNITTIADGINLITATDNNTNNNDKLPKTDIKGRSTVERNAYPYVVARKGVNTKSISARKGVDNITEKITTETINTIENERELNKTINKTNIIKPEPSSIENNNKTQLNIDKNNSNELNSLNTTTIKHIINTNKKKFRPKPTVTSVVGNDDDNSKRIVHGSPTKSPPLGMPTKINYVVPVIIIILILPLFVISMIYIYKNGRDCWEKRHYRRMDFLIDGMYNE